MKFVWCFSFLSINLAFSFALIEKTERTKEVYCETIGNFPWLFVGDRPTCYMNGSTVIDSNGFTIISPRDSTIGGLNFHRNKEISYLPVNVQEKFPNLEVLTASHCSVKHISKDNFKDLVALRVLWLEHNQIEAIPSDTLEDLRSLELLELSMSDDFHNRNIFDFSRLETSNLDYVLLLREHTFFILFKLFSLSH